MPPFRNLFPRRTAATNGVEPFQDENVRPPAERTDSQRSAPLSVKPVKDEPAEYKMSVVNDSGEYLPPSPTEKKGFWHRSTNSTTSSSNHRSLLAENEPFSISRESFESYRRSFDISARSPVSQADSIPSRQSLDSRAFRHPNHHRGAVNGSHFERPQRTEEEAGFEDVGLNDDPKPKKKSIFSRFTDSSGEPQASSAEIDRSPSAQQHHGFHIPGRKRGQSGQGSELGSLDGFHIPGRRRGLSGKGAELGKEEKAAPKDKGDGVIR